MKTVPIPTGRLMTLTASGLFLLLSGYLWAPLTYLGAGMDILLAAACLWEIFILSGQIILRGSFSPEKAFTMGGERTITLILKNEGSRPCAVLISMELPPFWIQIINPVDAMISAHSTSEIKIKLKPLRRGKYSIKRASITLKGPLGLFDLNRRVPLEEDLIVYPELKELREYLTLSRDNRLYKMGIHKSRYKGQGTELESLREYTPDDDIRFIDWKATARANKPITRSFQMENHSQIVFALDCGRLMTTEESQLSSLDLAINALLVLSHVAVNMGDRIRIIAFSDQIKGDFLSPKSSRPMEKILDFLSPLQPEFVESNYLRLFNHLHKTLKRRSLIIFLSDLIDDSHYDLFSRQFTSLGRKHRLIFLLLRDELLQREAERTGRTQEEIYRITAARSLLLQRHETLTRLQRTGVQLLDLLPFEVTSGLVDKYLQLKGQNRV